MIMLALLVSAAPSAETLDRADRANEAHLACLFAKSREAHAARIPVAEFKRKLATACLSEERLARRLMTSVLSARGERDAAGQAQQLISEARSSIVATYQSLPKIESQFEELAEICREQPDACR